MSGLLALVLLSGWLCAQQGQPPLVAPEDLTLASVTARLDALEADEQLEPEQREQLQALWEQTRERLLAAQRWAGVRADFSRRSGEVPQALAEEQKRWERGQQDQPVVLPTNASLEQLEALHRQAADDQGLAQADLDAIETRLAARAERRADIPQRLAELRSLVGVAPEPVAGGDEALLGPAQRALARATASSRDAEIAALEAEREYYEGSGALLALQRDLAERERDRADDRLAIWTEAVTRAREGEAEAAVSAARVLLANVPESLTVLHKLAERELELASKRREFGTRVIEVASRLDQLRSDRAKVEDLRREADRRIKAAGYSHTVSLILRRQRTELPGYLRIEAKVGELAEDSDEVHLDILDWEAERRGLARPDAEAERLIDEQDAAIQAVGGAPLSAQRRSELQPLALQLASAHRAVLDPLVSEGNVLFNQLADLEMEVLGLSRLVKSQIRFIDEHVLWVRSAGTLGVNDLLLAAKGLVSLPGAQAWGSLVASLHDTAVSRPGTMALYLGLLLMLFVGRLLSRGQVRSLGRRQPKRATAPVGPTVIVAALTLLRAAWWPTLALLVGGLISGMGAPPFAAALGEALQRLAPAILPVELLIEVCRPLGLAEAHLGWPESALRSVRRQSRLLQVVVLPALLLSISLDVGEGHALRDSLGRLALILALLGLGVFARNLLTRRGAVHQALRARRHQGWLLRARPLWYPLVVGGPVVLAGAVALGFSYAGLQVGLALIHTSLLVLAMAVSYELALRWISRARLRLRLEQVQRRREIQAGQEARSLELSGEIQAVVEEGAEERDVVEISAQASRLLNIAVGVGFLLGLGLIWADLLPALNTLGGVSLWSTRVESLDDASGGLATALRAITLGDLVLALIVSVLTVVAARNIPGLLEITVLRRVTLEPGGSYAITTLCRYLITATGVVVSAGLVGLTWNKVQWLAAAVTVGLGFGLQEIFANFVSGLIILFERPIRVGDIVTVGGIEGVVTRIRTRATTIRDRDRRELLVPNKEFITGQLVNWTLTDPISRLVIPVGVSYESDTALAEATLLDVGRGCRQVLENPAPQVIFRSFGESTLDYELRVFIADRDFWPQVTHDLNMAIHKAFVEQGIEIAFPQRDIHVRTMGPGGGLPAGDPATPAPGD